MGLLIKTEHYWFKKIDIYFYPDKRKWVVFNTFRSPGNTGDISNWTNTKYHSDKILDIDDLYYTFSLLSTTKVDDNIAEIFLSTPLPDNIAIEYYDEQHNEQHNEIKSYEDIFNIIGDERDTFVVNNRRIPGYPDSVYLAIDCISPTCIQFRYGRYNC